MKFKGSGFAIELPDGAIDASSYMFVFPELGDLSPNLAIRFEPAVDVVLIDYVAALRKSYASALEQFKVIAEDVVKPRGDWLYTIHVVEWGVPEYRLRQKQLFIQITQPSPRLYTLTGTDLADNYALSEPVFDQIIRSFNPDVAAIG